MPKEKSKPKKERSSNYEEKVVIKGTLDNVLKVSVPKPKPKEERRVVPNVGRIGNVFDMFIYLQVCTLIWVKCPCSVSLN